MYYHIKTLPGTFVFRYSHSVRLVLSRKVELREYEREMTPRHSLP